MRSSPPAPPLERAVAGEARPTFWSHPHVQHPNRYVWFVFISTMDLIVTWIVLHAGGYEANVLASAVMERYDLPGAILFKFCMVALIIVLCENISRHNLATGRRVTDFAIIATCVPVIIGFHLIRHAF